MKLLIAIVNDDDVKQLTDSLVRGGHRFTQISTTGGFLRAGNATLLLGIEEAQVDTVLEMVKQNCHTRTKNINPVLMMGMVDTYVPSLIEVQVGGAIVFMLNVERFERF